MPNRSTPYMIPKKSILSFCNKLEMKHTDLRLHTIGKKGKRTLTTELTDIEGIGEKKANLLLKNLGSVQRVKDATMEELERIVGVKIAKKIFNYFRH